MSANRQAIVIMAITKAKQLLNELSYLVMALSANAFIATPLKMCVLSDLLDFIENKSASLINSIRNCCKPKISSSFAQAIDF